MNDPKHLNQIDLIAAIAVEIERQHKGPVQLVPRTLNAIIEAANLIVYAFAKPHQPSVGLVGLEAWLGSDDCGMSSIAMVVRFEGTDRGVPDNYRESEYTGHPHDPDDFGRCVRLLDAVPEYRYRLGEMASVSDVWSRLIFNWDELETLYAEELPTGRAPKLYQRMKDLIDAS